MTVGTELLDLPSQFDHDGSLESPGATGQDAGPNLTTIRMGRFTTRRGSESCRGFREFSSVPARVLGIDIDHDVTQFTEGLQVLAADVGS